jgi:acetyl esterase
MALDPKAQALLTAIAAANLPAPGDLPVETLRELVSSRFSKLSLPCKKVGEIINIHIKGTETDIPLRIYVPEGNGPFPVVLFFHGGGWVLFNLDNYDPIATHLCHEARCVVVSVDYRLAPEHKFPAAVVDCYEAACWTADHISEYSGDQSKIALAGDSAGGNLVAAVTFRLRDEGGPACCAQVMLYPVVDYYTTPRSSYREFAEGFGLTYTDMEWFWAMYISNPLEAKNPLVCPILATDLSGLPPAFVMVAGNDLLRDEGIEYAHRLQAAGVPTHLSVYDEMIHGFISYIGILRHARTAITEISRWLDHRFDSHVHMRFRSP